MKLPIETALTALVTSSLVSAFPTTIENKDVSPTYRIAPKVFIFSFFESEAEMWWGIPEFDILARNITIPGFSPLFPDAHCTADGAICQLVTGEAEINAAVTVASLVASAQFDLTSTYFLSGGIAGINPEVATVSSVTFARYAVQVALQYEFDPREIPANFSAGYIPQGSSKPDEYPQTLYGTEVFEVNDALRKLAVGFAKTATLNDSNEAIAYRALYDTSDGLYARGAEPPGVVECDVATADVYFSGKMLGEAFGNYTKLATNGTGVYCTTAQEDNATLEALLRAHVAGLVDFSRIIIMRTASDMDRPYPGQAATTNLFWANQGAFEPAIQNIYLAGVKIVEGILDAWDSKFAEGIELTNYIGDVYGTIGGTPDFGPGPVFEEDQTSLSRRGVGRRTVKKGQEMKGRRGWVT